MLYGKMSGVIYNDAKSKGAKLKLRGVCNGSPFYIHCATVRSLGYAHAQNKSDLYTRHASTAQY